jgi:hypothetical protein
MSPFGYGGLPYLHIDVRWQGVVQDRITVGIGIVFHVLLVIPELAFRTSPEVP